MMAERSDSTSLTLDTMVWNVEPQGWYDPYFVSKYHLDNGFGVAKCSSRIILNMPVPDRPIIFGGPTSFGDGGQAIGSLPRDSVCRGCVPRLPR